MGAALRAASVFTLMLAISLGAAVLIARRSEYPPSRWLTYSLCRLPCWRGIVPGVTRFIDAQRLLRAQPDVTCCFDFIGASQSRATFHVNAGGRTYMGVLDADGMPSSTLNALAFFPDRAIDRAPLQALFDEIGYPQQLNIVTVRAKQAVYFYFVPMRLTVTLDPTVATLAGSPERCAAHLPDSLVESIVIANADVRYWSGQPWQGFGALADDLCRAVPVTPP